MFYRSSGCYGFCSFRLLNSLLVCFISILSIYWNLRTICSSSDLNGLGSSYDGSMLSSSLDLCTLEFAFWYGCSGFVFWLGCSEFVFWYGYLIIILSINKRIVYLIFCVSTIMFVLGLNWRHVSVL